jgi:hypothetical protein
MAAIRAKVKVATDKRYVGRALSVVGEDLNPVLRVARRDPMRASSVAPAEDESS